MAATGQPAGGPAEDAATPQRAALKQREDIKAQRDGAGAAEAKGLDFAKPAPDSFRAKLRDAGFYGEWKSRFGDEAWGL